MEVRRHWIVLVPEAVFLGVVMLLPIFVYALVSALPIVWHLGGGATSLALYVYGAWLLLGWAVGFVMWIDYYLDMWVVTDRRLIDVDQKGLFRREVASIRFEKIEEIKAETDGILATYLGFGTIRVQTAAETTEFAITSVADPQKMVDAINSRIDRLNPNAPSKPTTVIEL